MDLESIEKEVDILRFAVFQLLQDSNLMQSLLDAVILRCSVDFIVLRVDVNDLESDYTIILDVLPTCEYQQGFEEASQFRATGILRFEDSTIGSFANKLEEGELWNRQAVAPQLFANGRFLLLGDASGL